jgi:TrmH family RNA methyltransferase
MELISSRNNPRIKQVRALRQRKGRQEARLFIVEGIRHVGEAVEAGAPLEAIFHAPELLDSAFARNLLEEQARHGVPCYATTAEVFAWLAEKENPQGILAVARQTDRKLGDLTPQNFPWGVALVSPQDPGNLGTILRSIDAVGASGLLLLEDSVDPYHPSAVRASMGALFWNPVVSASFADFAAWTKQQGYHVYGTSAHGNVAYSEVQAYQFPCILLMGSEREGLTQEQTTACEKMIRLPMRGRATSLNLSVAAGVMLYAILGSALRRDSANRKEPAPVKSPSQLAGLREALDLLVSQARAYEHALPPNNYYARAAAVTLGELGRKALNEARDLAESSETPSSPTHPFSRREMEVLGLATHGLTNKEIAYRLGISERTVQFHINSIFNKTGAQSRTEAVALALKRGWIGAEE